MLQVDYVVSHCNQKQALIEWHLAQNEVWKEKITKNNENMQKIQQVGLQTITEVRLTAEYILQIFNFFGLSFWLRDQYTDFKWQRLLYFFRILFASETP